MADQPPQAPRRSMLILPFVPLALAIVIFAVSDYIPELASLLRLAGVVIAIMLCIEYAHQLSYIKHQLGKSIKSQKVLVWAALLVPAAAAFAGDAHGVANFGSEAGGGGLMIGLIASLFVASIVINIMAIINVVTILTRGRYQAVDLISTVLQALLWLGMFYVAYFIYALMYSLRDPSTE